jgi:hypothetical protein
MGGGVRTSKNTGEVEPCLLAVFGGIGGQAAPSSFFITLYSASNFE